MAQHKVTHPTYGERTVEDRQVETYLRLGWTQGAEVVPEAVAASIKQVLADVGDDPVKAHAALDAEQSRTSPRQNLVTALVRVIEPDTKES